MRNLIYLALFTTSLLSCSTVTNEEEIDTKNEVVSKEETGFVHVVYFWLKEDLSDEDRKQFEEEGLGTLATCPTIQKVFYGPPAMTPRDVVDNSYSYAWICHFKNKEDQDAYQVEPIHLKFIEDYSSMWTKVQVYDNLVNN